MTQRTLLARRRRLTTSVKREIRRLWRTREYDTMQLAEMMGVEESVIYRLISGRVELYRRPSKPQPKPIPRYAGYDPTERRIR